MKGMYSLEDAKLYGGRGELNRSTNTKPFWGAGQRRTWTACFVSTSSFLCSFTYIGSAKCLVPKELLYSFIQLGTTWVGMSILGILAMYLCI